MASHLTDSEELLWRNMVASLTDYSYLPLTQSRAHYLATVASDLTGQSYSHLTTSYERLLAIVATELSGSTVSQLTLSRAAMMAVIVNNPPEGEEESWIEDFRSPGGDLPFAAFRFTSGEYWMDGEEVAVTAMLGNGDGGNFNQSAITASGMLVDGGNDNRPFMSAALLALVTAALPTGFTCVIKFDNNTAITGSVMMGLYDATDAANGANEAYELLRGFVDGDVVQFGTEMWSGDHSMSSAETPNAGIKKFAFNANRSDGGRKTDISLGGAAALTSDAGVDLNTITWLACTVGHDSAGSVADIYIQELAFYALQPLADLDNLSTP